MSATDAFPSAAEVLAGIWRQDHGSEAVLDRVDLGSDEGWLRSSFAVGVVAQASIAAAAAASLELWQLRGGPAQEVRINRARAEAEVTGLFTLDGETPATWDPFSGLFECRNGHVRVHTNFAHHRDGVLRLLGLGSADQCTPDDLAEALAGEDAEDFEARATVAGLVVAKVRSFDEWDTHPQSEAVNRSPLVHIRKIAEAPPHDFRPLPDAAARPLSGVRVLDLTRILAGPVCGRTLAAYGAQVLLVNGPHLPNISAISDTSRGKRSALLDLRDGGGAAHLSQLVHDADVFVQGYRPGGLRQLGYSPEALAELRPGIVAVSLSAYGANGPWSGRRGFDSLVQTATGFNDAEAQAFGRWRGDAADDAFVPKALPVQILDYASGFLMAYGAQVALARRLREGGSWHVEVSLARTAAWLRSLGQNSTGFERPRFDLPGELREFACDHALLKAMPHAAEFSLTDVQYAQASCLPGTHPAAWW